MPVAEILNINGERMGDIKLNDSVFGVEVNKGLLHEVVRMSLANKRQGTASTKTRGEVSGGGRKPWRQKGTGRARHGSIRSPIWVGGGVTFGPTPRKYSYSMPKKAMKAALKSALSARAKGDDIIVLDSLVIDEPKTREMYKIIKNLNIGNASALIVTENRVEDIFRAARNIPRVTYVSVDMLNVYDIIRHDKLIVTQGALERIGEVCS